MRCTLSGFLVDRRMASSTTGPMVILGTNRPSITSTWIQSAPAASTARTSSPKRVKSADKIEGAMRIDGAAGTGGFTRELSVSGIDFCREGPTMAGQDRASPTRYKGFKPFPLRLAISARSLEGHSSQLYSV